jgi:hypothetical protein
VSNRYVDQLSHLHCVSIFSNGASGADTPCCPSSFTAAVAWKAVCPFVLLLVLRFGLGFDCGLLPGDCAAFRFSRF